MSIIGEIRSSADLGLKSNFKYIYISCPKCGEERWTGIFKGKPRFLLCYSCKVRIRGGLSRSHIYYCWSNMHRRCNCSKNVAYKTYGGRGITVCNDWNDFYVFKDWALNNGYEEGLTIDRIDNNGNYEPNNCQWVSLSENVIKDKNKKVKQYDLNGSLISTYNSVKEARSLTSVCKIDAACRGERKTAGGYTWKFELSEAEQERTK